MSDNIHKLFKKSDLIEYIKKLGVKEKDVLHLKVSLKAIGPILGGAKTLLDAFKEVIGPNGTIVVSSFVESYPLPLSEENSKKISAQNSPSCTGVFNDIFLEQPNVVRSNHPTQRFAAIGPLAQELVGDHNAASRAYLVHEKLCTKGAINISIGKNIMRSGTCHIATEITGLIKKPSKKGVNYLDTNGQLQLYRADYNGGCAKGFDKFVPLYEAENACHFGKIGNAVVLVSDMNHTLSIELETLRETPSFFFCDDPTCKDCRLNWEHSNGNYLIVKLFSLFKILKNKCSVFYD